MVQNVDSIKGLHLILAFILLKQTPINSLIPTLSTMIVKYEKQQGKKGNHFMLLKKELFISSNFFLEMSRSSKYLIPKWASR